MIRKLQIFASHDHHKMNERVLKEKNIHMFILNYQIHVSSNILKGYIRILFHEVLNREITVWCKNLS